MASTSDKSQTAQTPRARIGTAILSSTDHHPAPSAVALATTSPDTLCNCSHNTTSATGSTRADWTSTGARTVWS